MLKKTILLSSLSLFTLASSFAQTHVEKPTGWYVEGSLQNIVGTGRYLNDLTFNSEFLKNPTIGAELGYKFGRLRAGAEYDYGYQSLYYGDLNTHTLGLSGYFDFDNSSIFSPYLGLGVRKTYYDFNSQWGMTYDVSTDPYMVGMIGMRAYFNSQFALDLKFTQGLINTNHYGALGLGVVYQF